MRSSRHFAAGGLAERRVAAVLRALDGDGWRLLAVTDLAEQAVAELGLCPVAVTPLMVFDGHRLDEWLGRVRLVGRAELAPMLLALPERMSEQQVAAVTGRLAKEFPPYEDPGVPPRRAGHAGRPARPAYSLDPMSALRRLTERSPSPSPLSAPAGSGSGRLPGWPACRAGRAGCRPCPAPSPLVRGGAHRNQVDL